MFFNEYGNTVDIVCNRHSRESGNPSCDLQTIMDFRFRGNDGMA